MMGTHVHMVSHPAFQQLLTNGVPYATINRWFSEIIATGVDPHHHQKRFMSLLGKKVKQTLNIAAEKNLARHILFTGAPGAGKSSIVMKLALHPTILENANCALVSVRPPEINYLYSPLKAFAAECELTHYELKEEQQLFEWETEWAKFEHVLIEMPNINQYETPNWVSAKGFRKRLPADESLEVHNVINATQTPGCFNSQNIANNLPTPDYLDFTYLDRAPQKGHLLPLMHESGCRVRYVSSGPHIPDDISKFEPARFARQLLSNQ